MLTMLGNRGVLTLLLIFSIGMAPSTLDGADKRRDGRSRHDAKRSEKFSGPRVELPDRGFDFRHLRLECEFDWKDESVTGTVTHDVTALRSGLRTLDLHSAGIDVKSVEHAGGPPLRFETHKDKLRIHLGQDTSRGDELRLRIHYRAQPQAGVYFQGPSEHYPNVPEQLWTQGETKEARHWIPCFDHPSERLTSEVLIAARKPKVVVSNGRLLSKKKQDDGRILYHWLQDKSHTTYLISVVVGEFATYKVPDAKIPMTCYVPLDQKDNAARSFKLTGDMMSFFNETFGYPYPWDKYDQLCVYGFPFGGMENTTVTTLTTRTLHDERAGLYVSSVGLVAHELAHQWFGDLVTCRNWGDIWLNESFATFSENYYREHRFGWDEGVFERYQQAESYKREDRNRYRRRLSVRSWAQSGDVFDSHAYPKGARILNMLRYVVGEEAFSAGLKHYLERNAFRSVETADFRIAMEEATGKSLRWFFDQWVHSGGHPEYSVKSTWSSTAKTLSLEVEQTQKVDDLTPLFRMPVVLAVVTPSGRREHKVKVSKPKEVFTFPAAEKPRLVRFDPGDWILKELTFEKTKEELLYQLVHDPDVMGRHRAAKELEKYADHPDTARALLKRLETEPFWGVRQAIALALAKAKPEQVVSKLTARLKSDPKSAVRQKIAATLGQLGDRSAAGSLRESVANDRSYHAAAAALKALGTLLEGDAYADAQQALDVESHRDVMRIAAIEILSSDATVSGKERKQLLELLTPLAAPGHPFNVRAAALRGLSRVGKGTDQALAVLTDALSDPAFYIRWSAISALGELGDARAISALEARRAKERPGLFRDAVEAIDEAVEKLKASDDPDGLKKRISTLEAANAELEKRVEALEEREEEAKTTTKKKEKKKKKKKQ